jgi:membrane protease YdiL (CAAX protease family)
MRTTENDTRRRAPLREVVAFTAVTFALSAAVSIALPDADINVLLTSFVPVVAVAILTFTMFRRGTRGELWRSTGVGRAGARTWVSAFGLPCLLCGGAFATALLVGAGHVRPLHLTGLTVVSFIANFAFGLVAVMGEEIGWRGFMLPRIQQLTSKRRAALVTGFAHGLFHLPLILIASTYDNVGSRWLAAPAGVLLITAAGVFYAWLWDRSGSSWAVSIGHLTANLTFAFAFIGVASTTSTSLAFWAGETGVATLGAVVILAVVLLMRAKVWQEPKVVVQVSPESRRAIAVR